MPWRNMGDSTPFGLVVSNQTDFLAIILQRDRIAKVNAFCLKVEVEVASAQNLIWVNLRSSIATNEIK